MNKRIYLLFITLLTSMVMMAQGLRTSVCIVYPECTTEDSLILCNYAKQLASVGFTSDAQMLRAYTGHSFGSGVLTDRYVLTNRHVVGYAKTVKLVFELHDKTLTFEHCRVVSTSTVNDIAAIELPKDMSQLHALSIDEQQAQDSEDIFAAGFPGLQGNPSWQLTRGTISNAALRIEDVHYIQHTAAIDPGSSGGPLLRKVDGKFHIIGLNTMKAFGRDRVGLAINEEQLRDFIQGTPNTDDQHVLEQMASVDSKLWNEYYKNLPDSMKQVLHDMEIRLPMDRVLAVAEFYGGPENMQQKVEDKKRLSNKQLDKRLEQNRVSVGNLEHPWKIAVSYDYYSVPHADSTITQFHLPAVNFEYGRHYLLTGVTMGVPISTDSTIYVSAGVRIGLQVPILFAAYHALIPRISIESQYQLLVKPRVTTREVTMPIRAGLDYQYQLNNCSLIFGIQYVLRPNFLSGSSPKVSHGVSARIGVAI